ncbi:hypothetical protein SteCoe_20163 [Stentor coeruleus]|uniref:Uncharacterized protein n=1 Tax=Stentor coeruleus TaxID=5963 RepID=A0A1R2BSL1_9CILI|nr:hypothetical protein SteCoe_20163 [Stentor coeruleus]
MSESKRDEKMLYEKYEALLNGFIPEDFKDDILYDKINLLQKQNTILENTILSLRHELTNLIGKQEYNISLRGLHSCRCSSLTSSLKKSIVSSEFEIPQFSDKSSKMFGTVKKTSEGINALINARRDQFENPGRSIIKRYSKGLIPDSPSTKGSLDFKAEILQSKINSLKISLGKSKNEKDQLEIENQKLLLQLKQAKEQLALCEENSSSKEVAYANKIKKLNYIISKLKDIPNLSELINKCEREVGKHLMNHKRSRSSLHSKN